MRSIGLRRMKKGIIHQIVTMRTKPNYYFHQMPKWDHQSSQGKKKEKGIYTYSESPKEG